MNHAAFSPADILLPQSADLQKWSVVACDQYTSEPEYWERVEQTVGDAPSAYRMILPECWLGEKGLGTRIDKVNKTMRDYLDSGLFRCYPDAFLYLERTLAPGKVRRGLVGKLDLEAYEYTTGSQSPVRPTEGTVESRLPPRIRVRAGAPLETPHIMVLIDDPARSVIEPLANKTARMEPAYDFKLMENGGALRGWAVDSQTQQEINAALAALETQQALYSERFAAQHRPLLFAVGDGNHSLATAKACFEELKKQLPEAEWQVHPARWALVELVNVHDEALEFEPIHRVLFGVDPAHVLSELKSFCGAGPAAAGSQSFEYVVGSKRERLYVADPPAQLAAGTLQKFIDGYLAKNGGEVDYIHGGEVAAHLAKNARTVAFLLPVMKKTQLFQTVLLDGALPRKTFSMGHAHEKRFYLECRKIK